jgi:hypothetical protein
MIKEALFLIPFLLLSTGCKTSRESGVLSNRSPMALDRTNVLNAMVEANETFYKSGEIYEVPYDTDSSGKKLPPNPKDPADCYASCPKDRWSPLICTYFCQFPAYSNVIPNIRGCFVRVVQYLKISIAGTNEKRTLNYNEAYDYCVYQNYDAILGRIPAFDSTEIAKNKLSGEKPGVMKWVDDHQKTTFQTLMFTNGDPNAFDKDDVAWILDQFKLKSGFGAASY